MLIPKPKCQLPVPRRRFGTQVPNPRSVVSRPRSQVLGSRVSGPKWQVPCLGRLLGVSEGLLALFETFFELFWELLWVLCWHWRVRAWHCFGGCAGWYGVVSIFVGVVLIGLGVVFDVRRFVRVMLGVVREVVCAVWGFGRVVLGVIRIAKGVGRAVQGVVLIWVFFELFRALFESFSCCSRCSGRCFEVVRVG